MTTSEEEEQLVKCVELPGRGRGLVTTKAVHGGQVILRESPSLLYVAASESLNYCGSCLRTCPAGAGGRSPCPGCSGVIFCSAACSLAHSPHLCSALGRLEAAGFEGDSADQARFLLAAYHLALSSRPDFERLMLLEGVGVVDGPARELHAFVENAVCGWPWSHSSGGPESVAVVSEEVTAGLLAKDARNTFGIMAPFKVGGERSVRGFGVYRTASFINHDCLPNSCRFDYFEAPGEANTDIVIRGLYDIPQNTEVTISYFPINWSFKLRADRLIEEYGFKCLCKRCQVEECWSESESEVENNDEDDDEDGLVSPAEPAGSDESHRNVKSAAVNEEGEEMGDDSFEHAMYFVKFLCPIDGCGGTLAPLASTAVTSDPADATMECNMCGRLRTGDELRREAADADAWEEENELK